MEAKIIIALDGFAACGKSTLARALAKQLNYVHVDSGAMYRAVALYGLNNQVDWNKPEQVQEALEKIHIEFEVQDAKSQILLNTRNVEAEIRSLRISQAVSLVSTITAVRRKLVQLQRKLGERKGLVMDGRDIGTVVFPRAELKLFVRAHMEVRAERRLLELRARGNETVDIDSVKHNLLERDRMDSSRKDSPLRQAADAIVIDNSDLTPQQQLEFAFQIAQARINE